MPLTENQIREFGLTARKLRQRIVTMIGPDNPGHLGGSCSIADILTIIVFSQNEA